MLGRIAYNLNIICRDISMLSLPLNFRSLIDLKGFVMLSSEFVQYLQNIYSNYFNSLL